MTYDEAIEKKYSQEEIIKTIKEIQYYLVIVPTNLQLRVKYRYKLMDELETFHDGDVKEYTIGNDYSLEWIAQIEEKMFIVPFN